MCIRDREEAVDAISAYAQSVDDAVLTLNANEKSVEVSAQELGITFQNTNAVQEALAVGRNGNLIKRDKDKKDLEHGSKVFELPLGLNAVSYTHLDVYKRQGFDFLGMHHRRMTTETSKGQLYKETYQYPSRKAMKKMKAEIKKNVNGRSLLVAKEEDLIKNLNPKIIGWKNYYSTKTNETWMQELDWYIICTFTRWYNKKHQRRKHMSRVGFVRNSIYEKGLKKMARA